MRRRVWWGTLLLLVGTFLLGIGLRFGHFGQGLWVRKYGGSVTWAMEIYWLISGVLRCPSRSVRGEAVDCCGGLVGSLWSMVISGMIGTAVEFLKLVHTPWLEWFRGTLAGVLLLGRFFSWWDILAYWVAVGTAAVLDRWMGPHFFPVLGISNIGDS